MFFSIALVLSIKLKHWTLLWLPFVIAIGWGAYAFGLNYLTLSGYSILNAVFYLEGGMGIVALLYFILKRPNLKFMPKVILPASFTVLGVVFLTWSMTVIPIAIATSVSTVQVLISSVLGSVFF